LAGLELEARAPRADWSGEFEWSPRLRSVLASTFSLSDFRPLQEEVINASMQGRDVLCLMPSGGGKSLCYQIPALVEQKVTLVVSPLLSLIQDQVQGLRSLGVRAEGLSSMSAKEEQQAVFKSMDSPDSGLLLLYVTPERVASSKRFLGKLDKLYHAGRLGRIAVDEAHCCSQWGNDFRPDYKKLGVLKQQFPQTPIIALTATATERVCADLREILGIENSELFRKSINRPNLFYEVAHKPGSADAQVALILDWIHHHYGAGDSGIVYCLTQKDTEAMATKLQAAGLSAGCYHANMDPAERQWVHSQWSVGALQIITATIAFGMGINKPDVRFVIHETLSKSLENYYQESGRAGRDGRPARCLLLHRFSDIPRQASLVCLEPRWEHNLRQAMLYAGSRATCRRATLAMHFGEAPSDCGGMCDVCAARYPFSCVAERDITAQGQAVLRTLAAQQQVQKKCTLLQLWERWRTSKAGDDAKLAKGMTREEAEEVVAQLMYKSFLDFEFGYTAYATTAYLCCSAKSMLLLNGRGTLTAPAQLPSLLEREKVLATRRLSPICPQARSRALTPSLVIPIHFACGGRMAAGGCGNSRGLPALQQLGRHAAAGGRRALLLAGVGALG